MSGATPSKPGGYFALGVADYASIMANFPDRQRYTALSVYAAICHLANAQGGTHNAIVKARIATIADAARTRYRAAFDYLHELQKLGILELKMTKDTNAESVIVLTWKTKSTYARRRISTYARNERDSVQIDRKKQLNKVASNQNSREYALS